MVLIGICSSTDITLVFLPVRRYRLDQFYPTVQADLMANGVSQPQIPVTLNHGLLPMPQGMAERQTLIIEKILSLLSTTYDRCKIQIQDSSKSREPPGTAPALRLQDYRGSGEKMTAKKRNRVGGMALRVDD